MPKKYARKCSVCNKGMNEGYCFKDGEDYGCSEKCGLKIAKKHGYKSIQDAYDQDEIYYTEWEKPIN